MTEKKRSDREEILRHLDKYGVVDKDSLRFSRKNRRRPGRTGRRQRNREILDLHGLTEEQAAVHVRASIERCKENGIAQVLIIHGKGYHSTPGEGPVLKKLVRTMLDHELRSIIRDWIPALPRDGGEGATVVRLR
ncbi:MAG: hypothetical protein GF401_15815 [Chitinivibrionales bacterium]|nr:hypothetical protein [Chitinivibrionales bacterium]